MPILDTNFFVLRSPLSTAFLLIFLCSAQFVVSQPRDPAWRDVLASGTGEISVVWFESNPFIYKSPDGQIKGIEFELIKQFRDFVKARYNVQLTIRWQEGRSFSDTYASVRAGRGPTLGLSAFSITQKREGEVDFSPPYMSDISVLITSDNIPILNDNNDFYQLIPKLTAITIRETTYEQELLRFQSDGHLPFSIKYIPSSQNIVRAVAAADSAFGFIDLPVYMMMFNDDPSIKVKRQNILPIKREGYAIIFPQGSDWAIPLNEFFRQPGFKSTLEGIISNYVDIDLYHFVEGLAVQSSDHTVMLLTKEKEIQYKDLMGKADIIVKETRMRNFLAAIIGIAVTSLIVIITLYRKQNEQKEKIQAQGQSIELKSKELEQRNEHLVALDEEKNSLIRILAHDLRTPINHIQGLAQIVLMEKNTLTPEQDMMVNKIVDSSVRLNKMITHLLDIDALENNRVTIFLEPIDLPSLLSKVINSFEKQAASKSIRLNFKSEASSLIVNADSLYLYEIFENLISNAIKFSPLNNQVDIELNRVSGNLRVTIRDYGQGMTMDDHAKLFRKYQRLSARPTAGESSVGLGLAIVKKYVEILNGRVWCESTYGHGASFYVEFAEFSGRKNINDDTAVTNAFTAPGDPRT